MKFRLPAGLAALALAATATALPAQELPAAKQVVDRYVTAIGGQAAVARNSSRRTQAEMTLPMMGTMTMDIYNARPNLVLVKTDLPGIGAITTGHDGKVVWAVDPMQGARILTGQEAQQTLQQSEFDTNVDFTKMYPTMETVERTTMHGRPCYKVKMVGTDGQEVFHCFDTESGLLVGTNAKTASQMGEVEAVVSYTDWQTYCGIKMPSKTTSAAMGMEVVLQIKSVSCDPIPASTFALPAEVKALVPAN